MQLTAQHRAAAKHLLFCVWRDRPRDACIFIYVPVAAERIARRDWIEAAVVQSQEMYDGARPLNALYAVRQFLVHKPCGTGSRCSFFQSCGVKWSIDSDECRGRV